MPSLLLFGGGLIAAIIAHAMAYASHLNFGREPHEKNWKIYRRLAVFVTAASIILFAVGGACADRAFFERAIEIKLKVTTVPREKGPSEETKAPVP
jgi:hypothetical protein